MNKSERINDMMIYLNNKSYFNLKDLMNRYQISKSTALRDVEALEALGMPIFTEHGRNGRYGILKNKLLSPILFRINEVYALYFAMLTLKGYQTTPFHLDLLSLQKKFESCLAEEQIRKLNQMDRVFSLEVSGHPNASPLLGDILEYCLSEQVCTVRYQKHDTIRDLQMEFFNISSSFGQWYVTGYNHETQKVQVCRCDRILSLEENQSFSPVSAQALASLRSNLFREHNAVSFKVYLTAEGVDLFYKEHYPSMQLEYDNQLPYIQGFYNEGEEKFIADYFLSYGSAILKIRPAALQNLMIERCRMLAGHFEQL